MAADAAVAAGSEREETAWHMDALGGGESEGGSGAREGQGLRGRKMYRYAYVENLDY